MDTGHSPSSSNPRPVVFWLGAVCLMIVLMVVVGGITRLTGSGLSMVEWKPILGAVPPMNEADWQEAFQQYQAYPQYQQQNDDMTLSAFKVIYFWEYLHRLLGRGIGIVFLLPYLAFLLRRQVRGALAAQLGLAFVIGGLQGLLGWYMVQSGLVDKPQVSHFRLAAHLALALALLVYLWWILLDLLPRRSVPGRTVRPALRSAAAAFGILLVLQIVYGAFVAGLKAGFFYNTFPTMQGFWFPPGMFDPDAGASVFVYNPVMVQFIHRGLGWVLGALSIGIWFAGRSSLLEPRARRSLILLPLVTLTQFSLGVLTLLYVVPVPLGALHQLTAALLLVTTTSLLHDLFTVPAGSVEDLPLHLPDTGALA